MINEIKRMQQLAGIKLVEELQINKKILPEIERVWEWVNDITNGEEIEPELENWLKNYLELNPNINYQNFKEIWAKSMKYYGCGDHGADWEYFESTWNWVNNGEWVEDDGDEDEWVDDGFNDEY